MLVSTAALASAGVAELNIRDDNFNIFTNMKMQNNMIENLQDPTTEATAEDPAEAGAAPTDISGTPAATRRDAT